MFSIVGLVAFLIMGAVGAFLIWFGWAYMQAGVATERITADLQAHGIRAAAQIVDRRRTYGRYRRFYITYKYSVAKPDGQSQEYTSEEPIEEGDYDRLNVKDQITVLYKPDDPKRVIIAAGATPLFTAGTFRINGVIAIVIGIAVVVGGPILSINVTITSNNQSATGAAYETQAAATPNASQRTATAQAAAATQQVDEVTLAQIKSALSTRLAKWQQVTDHTMHRVTPPETGLNLNEIEIDYGNCPSGHFYAYVWMRITDVLRLGYETDTYFLGYGFINGSDPAACYPKELAQVWLRDSGDMGQGWFAVNGAIDTLTVTATP